MPGPGTRSWVCGGGGHRKWAWPWPLIRGPFRTACLRIGGLVRRAGRGRDLALGPRIRLPCLRRHGDTSDASDGPAAPPAGTQGSLGRRLCLPAREPLSGRGVRGGEQAVGSQMQARPRGFAEPETFPLGDIPRGRLRSRVPGLPVDGEPVPPAQSRGPAGAPRSGRCFLKGVWAEVSPLGQDSSSKVDREHVTPSPSGGLAGLLEVVSGSLALMPKQQRQRGGLTHTSSFV